jgi:1-phosphofructokinase family hexose kinase
MILTVTPNTGVDLTLLVPEVELNKTIRASQSALGMGGKATDVSWILGRLGVANLATGFAAGYTGRQMVKMLEERGSSTRFVWTGGETRRNTILIAQDGRGQSTFTTSTLEVLPRHLSTFKRVFQECLSQATCLVLGGSLPRGVPTTFFKGLIELARAQSIPVLFDASGPGLLAGLEGHPDLIKPNRVELEEITGTTIHSREETFLAAKWVQQKYGCTVVATIGREGAFAVLAEHSYWIPGLNLEVVSSAGAGDGVLAGLAVAFSQHKPIEEGLRLGFALATAVLQTLPTADFNPKDLERIYPLIELLPYSGTNL